MLHHFHVFLHACQQGCLTWLHIVWQISWAWNNRPRSFVKWLRFLLKVSLCSQCDTFCPRLLWAFWCLIAWIFCRQFWTSSVHAFTQTNIAKFSVLGTFTSMPEHPSVSKILTSALAQCCFWDWFFGVDVYTWNWWVCQLLRKVCWALQRGFWLALFEGIARFSSFLRNLPFYTVEGVPCLWSRSLFRQPLLSLSIRI